VHIWAFILNSFTKDGILRWKWCTEERAHRGKERTDTEIMYAEAEKEKQTNHYSYDSRRRVQRDIDKREQFLLDLMRELCGTQLKMINK
jgi:hypothetical protein